jgi:uncharacterized protein (UPF0248 family)
MLRKIALNRMPISEVIEGLVSFCLSDESTIPLDRLISIIDSEKQIRDMRKK